MRKLLLAAVSLTALVVGSQAQNLGFEDGTITGWTSSTLSATGSQTVQAGSNTWVINPYGSYMGTLQIQSGTFNQMTTALGLTPESSTSITTLLQQQAQTGGGNPNPTTAGWVTKEVALTAGQTFTLAWQYISVDYVPFNDGSIATLTQSGTNNAVVNNYVQQYALLGFTNPGTGDYSTGSYGATGWQVATFSVSTSGTYTLGFGVFNLGDQALSPILYVDEVQGTTTLNGQTFGAVAPNNSTAPAAPGSGGGGGGTPSPTSTVNAGDTAGTGNLASSVTVNGGTIQVAASGVTLTNTFTVDNNGMTVDQNGNTVDFSGVISGTGGVTIANTGTGGGVTFSAVNTYTGTTTVNNGSSLTNTGTIIGPVVNQGTFTNSGTAGSVTNSGTFTNSVLGTITSFINNLTGTNNGTIAGTVTNNSAGTFTNNGTVQGTTTNDGNLINTGTLADLTNSGTANNSGTISGTTTNSGTFTNSGTTGSISNTGTVTNTGTTGSVTNSVGGTFNNNQGGSTGTVTNAGTWINSGSVSTVNNTGSFTNNATGTTGAFTNSNSMSNAGTVASLVNTGTVTNTGTITGTVTNTSGTITNSGTTGTVTNSGTVNNSGTTGAVTNNSTGIFNNNAGGNTGAVTNNGAFNNAGTTGTVTNNSGTFTNTGTTGNVVNDATVNNNGTTGDVTNNSTGTFTNYSNGTTGAVTNSGTLFNAGTIASIDNSGSATNDGTVTGNVSNTGSFFNGVLGTISNLINSLFASNDGTITGTVTNNQGGTFVNNSVVQGTVTNDGTVNNVGTMAGVDNNGTFTNSGTAGSFNNTGTVTNTGTLASLNNSGTATNSGTVTGSTVNSGTFNNSGTTGAVNNTGTFNSTGSSGALTNSGTAVISGNGNITGSNNSGQLSIHDSATAGDILNMAGGLLDFNGTGGLGYVTNSGTFNAGGSGTVAGLNNYGITNVSGSVSIGDVANYAGIINVGTTTATFGTIYNEGIFNIAPAGGNISVPGFTQTSTGLLAMSGSQKFNINGPAVLDGSLMIINPPVGFGRYLMIDGQPMIGSFTSLILNPAIDPLGGYLKYKDNAAYLYVTPSDVATKASIAQVQQDSAKINNLVTGQINNALGNDCTTFGATGSCAGFSFGNTMSGTGDLKGGTMFVSTRLGSVLADNYRIGIFLDKSFTNPTVGSVQYKSTMPIVGGFIGWNANLDGSGLALVGSMARSTSGSLIINRPQLAYAEGGSATTPVSTTAYQIKASYSMPVYDSLVATPYLALRHTRLYVDGYTEAGPIFPLSVDSYKQMSTDALAGLSLSMPIMTNVTASISGGIVQNLAKDTGSFSGSSEIANMFAFSMPNPGKGYTSAALGAGVAYEFMPNHKVGVSVGWQQKSLIDANVGSVGVSYIFGF